MPTIDRAMLARRALLDTLRVANLLDRWRSVGLMASGVVSGAQMVHNLEVDGRAFFERQVDKIDEDDLVAMSEGLALVLESLREEERGEARARRKNGK